ncbi:hypothetical protein [Leptothoe sp. PORK10 BA2]|uniref:hypothetical protein n=1 Tax=Leptothoe sp. PORK10 BA2 TaxID=3110254 RepID=UPI002B1F6846|nr:hypothetical protein [Leptothoe sp. PORK10 BA2]MEA5464474.1 hypothetical protein [Leptothoe sp. PORK10 BA2]
MPADSQVYFGMVLELGGKEISLEPQTAITEIRTKGIEVALPPDQTVEIGGVGENLKSILDSLNVESDSFLEIRTETRNGQVVKIAEIKDLPDIEVLKNIVNLLFNAQLAIQQFHVKVPPTHRVGATPADPLVLIPATERGDTRYTIGLSATWIGDAGVLFGDPQTGLKLKGLFFKASNEGI